LELLLLELLLLELLLLELLLDSLLVCLAGPVLLGSPLGLMPLAQLFG
jgi:hypothetical protein